MLTNVSGVTVGLQLVDAGVPVLIFVPMGMQDIFHLKLEREEEKGIV